MSESSFVPSDSSSSGSEEEQQKCTGNKRRQRSTTHSAGRNKSKKPKKSPVEIQNHDEFFNDLENLNASNNSVELTHAGDASLQSNLNQNSIDSNGLVDSNGSGLVNGGDGALHSILIRKMEKISNQLNQYDHDMGLMKKELTDIKRLIVKVEVLIKFRKESTGTDSDPDFLQTLQKFGLPITTKEKLDDLEHKLQNEDEKAKLVCLLHLVRFALCSTFLYT